MRILLKLNDFRLNRNSRSEIFICNISLNVSNYSRTLSIRIRKYPKKQRPFDSFLVAKFCGVITKAFLHLCIYFALPKSFTFPIVKCLTRAKRNYEPLWRGWRRTYAQCSLQIHIWDVHVDSLEMYQHKEPRIPCQ